MGRDGRLPNLGRGSDRGQPERGEVAAYTTELVLAGGWGPNRLHYSGVRFPIFTGADHHSQFLKNQALNRYFCLALGSISEFFRMRPDILGALLL